MATIFSWATPTILRNNADPVEPQDAATKSYVDSISGGTPGGANSEVQFNANGVFDGSANLTFDGSNLSVRGNVRAGGLTGSQLTISSTNGELVLVAGNIDVSNSYINNVLQPELPQDAATKSYVDSIAQGLQILEPCKCATAAPLNPYIYNNGTAGVGATIVLNFPGRLSIDGVTPDVGDRVLVKDESPSLSLGYVNGVYTVVNVGDGVTPASLIRATDNDTPSSFVGAYSFIESGSANGFSGWICTTPSSPVIVIGTTNIEWAQFSQAGTVEAGEGLSLDGLKLNVNTDNKTVGVDTDNNIYVLDEAQFVQPNIGVATGQDLTLTDYLVVGKDTTVYGELTGNVIVSLDTITAEGNISALNFTTEGNVDAGAVFTESVTGFGVTIESTGNQENIVLDPAGNISVSLKRVTNLAQPIEPDDATTKEYVDDLITTAISDFAYGNANVASYLANNFGPITATTLPNDTNNSQVATTAFVQSVVQSTGGYGNAQVASFLASGTNSSNIITSGSVTASSFIGDGSQLTGLPTGYTNANVAAYLPTYPGGLQSLTGPVITTGNIEASHFIGNGSLLTGMYSNTNVQSYLPTYTGNLTPGNVTVTGNLSATTLPNDANSNLVATTAFVQNVVEALGGYGNAQVAEFLPTYSGSINSLNVTGNLTARTILNTADNSNSVATTAFVQSVVTAEGGYGNAQVAAFLPSYTGNLTSLTGNVTTSATIQGAFIKGNGSQLTGMYGDADVADYLPTYTGGLVSLTDDVTTTANVQALYFKGDGSQLTNLPFGNYSNSNVQQFLGSNAFVVISVLGNITSTGNVSGAYLFGNGRFLTGVVSSYTDSNVANYLPSYTGNIGNNIGLAVTGNLSAVTPANGTDTTQVATTEFVQNAITANSYGNANVATYLPTYTGNLTPGNVLTNNYLFANGQPFNSFSNVFVTNTATIGNLVLTEGNINLGNSSISTGNGVAIGHSAKATSSTVAIGPLAGNNSTATAAVAVGNSAGQTNQNTGAVAVGNSSGQVNQGANAVAIGSGAGENSQGANAVAIGAFAGANSQPDNSIIINASGVILNGSEPGFYVKPVRNDTGNTTQSVYFNTVTNELTYAPSPEASTYGNANVAAYMETYTGNISANVVFNSRQIVPATPNVVGTGNITIYTATAGVTAFQMVLKAVVGANCVQVVDITASRDITGNIGYAVYCTVNSNPSVPEVVVTVGYNGSLQLYATSSASTTYTYQVTELI